VRSYITTVLKQIISAKRKMLTSLHQSTTKFTNNIINDLLSFGSNVKPIFNASIQNTTDVGVIKNDTYLTSSNPCSTEEFHCSSGECITKEYRCDSDEDCKDKSDENGCLEFECPRDSFVCGDGSCIPYKFKCDSEIDCKDGLDEAEITCTSHVCEELHNTFQCYNGACVDKRFVCDGDLDCMDGSDEEPCSECHKKMMFDCGNVTKNHTMKCLNKMYICDGIQDCADGSDEHEDRCRKYIQS